MELVMAKARSVKVHGSHPVPPLVPLKALQLPADRRQRGAEAEARGLEAARSAWQLTGTAPAICQKFLPQRWTDIFEHFQFSKNRGVIALSRALCWFEGKYTAQRRRSSQEDAV